MAMTLKEAVSYLLQSLEIGSIDDHGQIVLYTYYSHENKLNPPSRLILQTIENGLKWLIEKEYFRLDQVLDESDLQLLYKALRRELARADLPEQMVLKLGDEYVQEIRADAIKLLEAIIEQYIHLEYLRRTRQNC